MSRGTNARSKGPIFNIKIGGSQGVPGLVSFSWGAVGGAFYENVVSDSSDEAKNDVFEFGWFGVPSRATGVNEAPLPSP